MLVDTHAHLTTAELAADLPGVLARAVAAGVDAVVCVGIELKSSREAILLAHHHPRLRATVGVHPNDCSELGPSWLDELRSLARASEVVAIGEIGLDYYRQSTGHELQRELFRQQLDLAGDLGLPVVVHNREADEDVASILVKWSAGLAEGHPRGVLHCFSGDRDLMDAVVAAGFYVSFAGPITYQNGRKAAEMAASAPSDRVLVETDSPYLAPHPHRGKLNEPALVRLVVERLAELRSESVEEAIENTGRNARPNLHLGMASSVGRESRMSNIRTKPRVLVVDDNLQTLKLLRFLLEDEGYEVIVASNVRLARSILEGPPGPISLVMLDVMMPGVDGFEFCQELRGAGNDMPIIFLSARGDHEAKAEGLRMGADDFVAKPFDPTELLARVGAVLRRARPSGGVGESQPVLRLGEVELDAARLKVRTGPGRESDLTPTETKLLHCLMRNAGRVLTRDALISQVWDYDYDGNNNTVDVYIRRLRQKVEPDPNDPRYIRTVRGAGYIFQAA